MILQDLYEYYYTLLANDTSGKVPRPGWSIEKISHALVLSDDGELLAVIPRKQSVTRGKKSVEISTPMSVPEHSKRTGGIKAFFLCDGAGYMLGIGTDDKIDKKNGKMRKQECFEACAQLHESILQHVDCAEAQAVVRFFQTWDPAKAQEHPALKDCWDEMMGAVTFVFETKDARRIHDVPAIQKAWEANQMQDENSIIMRCLVTGERAPIAPVHNAIKSVAEAQSSGAALVSFNAKAYESYGKKQNFNAPISKSAAFAYTTALNLLISNPKNCWRMGDTTVLWWAQTAEDAYVECTEAYMNDDWSSFFGGEDTPDDKEQIKSIIERIQQGKTVQWNGTELQADTRFFILGISPNSARLSVRFFFENSFGAFIANMKAHYDRLDIQKPKKEIRAYLTPYWLLQETVNQNSKDKKPTELLTGATMRAILNNTPYPAALLNGVMLRIRAEREINWKRAAIIKAYYLKNEHPQVPKEVLGKMLNEQTNNTPYVLGRLFSVLEAVQQAANPGINATIRDRYFNAACATPVAAFPTLLKLANNHLKKLNDKLKVYYSKQLGEIMDKLTMETEAFPARLTQAEQGAFLLGYYHQTQARYRGKNQTATTTTEGEE